MRKKSKKKFTSYEEAYDYYCELYTINLLNRIVNLRMKRIPTIEENFAKGINHGMVSAEPFIKQAIKQLNNKISQETYAEMKIYLEHGYLKKPKKEE